MGEVVVVGGWTKGQIENDCKLGKAGAPRQRQVEAKSGSAGGGRLPLLLLSSSLNSTNPVKFRSGSSLRRLRKHSRLEKHAISHTQCFGTFLFWAWDQ